MPKKSCKEPQSSRLLTLADGEALPRHVGYKLVPCKYCKRTFFANRILKHEGICQKTQDQPHREIYDSTKFRLTGTVAEPFIAQVKAEVFVPPTHIDWRKGDAEFKAELQRVKQEKKALIQKVTRGCKPTLFQLDSYVQCPLCGRRFSKEAGKRHIPNCKNYCKKNATPEQVPDPSPAPVLRLPTRSRQSKLNLAEYILRFHQKHSRLC